MPRSFYLLSLSLPLSMGLSFYVKGWGSYLAILYAFLFLPLLELFIPVDTYNVDEALESSRKKDVFFDLLLWLMLPIQIFCLLTFCKIMQDDLFWYERIGLILAMGLGCGVIGINVAHELGHRPRGFEQIMAKLLLFTSLYGHFFIEHNKGHHKNVSTPSDPETARRNESIYRFWYRSIKDSFISALRIDPKEMKLILLSELIFCFIVLFYFGIQTLCCFLLSALIGILLLESVNYIEHYGLVRVEISPGKFEKVQPKHSWNADYILSRAALFELSRHSDHHAFANRKYQLLRHQEKAPQLPTGYPGMILLSLIPPLWFKVMNERLDQLN